VGKLSSHFHPPLNPLPSREGKEEERFPSRRGKKEGISHQGRG